MLRELNKHGYNCYLYVDDSALTTKGKREMNRAILVFEQWDKENSMKLNRKKCGILRLKKIE